MAFAPARVAMALPRFAALSLITLTTLALAACAGGPPEPRPWAETATRELHLSLATLELQGRRVAITRSQRATGPMPVVVYLPGLGQSPEAGQRWVAAWAQAGYAVLAVQPLDDDAAAWRSPLARTGEFRALGELHYGSALRAERLAALRRLLAAMQAQPLVDGVALDWQHAAVAGYETGAQTALDLGREADAWQPGAVIAISPPPMDTPAATPAALVITSDTDGDALGLVKQPAERRQAFESRPPGRAWLLSLPGLSHAALAGTLAPPGWHEQDQHHAQDLASPGSNPRGAGGNNGGGQHRQAGAPPRGPRSGSASEAAQADLREALQLSTAFLDARLRGGALPVTDWLQAR